MSEKEILLNRISQIAGQINRHKNQAGEPASLAHYQHPYNSPYQPPTRGIPGYRRASARGVAARGRGRGGRVAPVAHRNRTLVLNNSASNIPSNATSTPHDSSSATIPVTSTTQVTPASCGPDSTSVPASPAKGPQWVAKRDRHMQLINSSVYDQQAMARAKAMEATRIEKLKRRSEKQKIKLKRYLERSKHVTTPFAHETPTNSNHEIVIGGSKFMVSTGGNKLVRVTDASSKATHVTPKKAVVGGVTFIRSKNGNLWRSGLVKSSRGKMTTKKISKPCKFFTMTGKCVRGMSCPYTHDPNRVAICPRFLHSDNCVEGDSCDLSHVSTPHRVPACVHFLRGNCSNSNCRYAHIRVNPAAPVCRAFATEGYCEKGGDCTERHVHECPEFDEKGVCNDKKCKLPHIERASRKRMAAAAAAAAATTSTAPNVSGTEENMDESSGQHDDSDLSSDEEGEAIDSDDVDSDALSEEDENYFIQSDDRQSGQQEVNQQLDFIHF